MKFALLGENHDFSKNVKRLTRLQRSEPQPTASEPIHTPDDPQKHPNLTPPQKCSQDTAGSMKFALWGENHDFSKNVKRLTRLERAEPEPTVSEPIHTPEDLQKTPKSRPPLRNAPRTPLAL